MASYNSEKHNKYKKYKDYIDNDLIDKQLDATEFDYSDTDNNYAFEKLLSYIFKNQCEVPKYNDNSATAAIYPFTNENLNEVFKDLDLTNARVLTVGSSGDQALHSILCGAKDITIIDKNPYTEPFVELKIASIKNLDFKNYNNYFTSDCIFDNKYYAMVSHDLSPRAKAFWDNIMLELSDIQKKRLLPIVFQSPNFTQLEKNNSRYNTDESTFESLKKKLQDISIHYQVADFNKFHEVIDGNFDIILLSNVFDYIEDSDQFMNEISQLNQHLSDNGMMQVYYSFGQYKNKLYPAFIAKNFKNVKNIIKIISFRDMFEKSIMASKNELNSFLDSYHMCQ